MAEARPVCSAAGPLPARVLVVTGPTAAGKTELAVALAERIGAEIVGADSRQVYRELDAGTAKPGLSERRRAAHHLIDVVDPDEDYDASRWRDQALAVLAAIEGRGRAAIVCGGTGLYLRSLVRGLFRGPAADGELRVRLRERENAQPGSLHATLSRLDPRSAARIHANDERRLVRALEVHELTGRTLSDWHAEHRLNDRPFVVLTLEVRLEREALDRRIEDRSRSIVAAGITEELAALRRRYRPAVKAFDAIGYREAGQCLDGTLAPCDLETAIAAATRRYARRQLTWIRGQAETTPVAAGEHDAARVLAERFFDGVAKRQGIG